MNSANNPSDPSTQGSDLADRWQRTAVAAFFRAEARGFAPGYELDDWLAAEREIAAVPGTAMAAGQTMQTVGTAQGDQPPLVAASASRSRRAGRKAASAESAQPKAVASRKTAVTKRRSTRTRKTSPGVESELGSSA